MAAPVLREPAIFIPIEKRSNLKGLLWGGTGVTLFSGMAFLTAKEAAIYIATIAIKCRAKALAERVMKATGVRPVNSFLDLSCLAIITLLGNYLTMKASAYCLRNSINHLIISL